MPQVLHEYALRHWWIEAKIVTGLRSNVLFQTQVIFKTLHCPLSGLKRRGKGFIKTCAGVYLDLTWQFGYYHCGCGVFYASEEGEKMWSPWICLVPALFAEVLCSSEAQALGYAQSFVNTKHFVKTGCSTGAPKVLLSLYYYAQLRVFPTSENHCWRCHFVPVFLVDSSYEWNKSQAEIHPSQLQVTFSSTQPAAAQLLHQWIYVWILLPW